MRTDATGTRPDVLFRGPNDAEQVGRAKILVAIDDLYVAEYAVEAGGKHGGPHYHARHADSFYVIEGELEFMVDGSGIRAGAATLVAAPRGAIHAFPIAIGGPARFLNLHTPGVDFDVYVREVTAMRARGEKPTREFFERYDIYDV